MTLQNGAQCPRVLTIIVSYNFEPWIERCLGSLEQSHYPTDVVVVDNASTDRTVEILAEKYRWVRLLRSQRNLGFGQANNLGMKIAIDENYDYVFLLNQDACIEPDTIGSWVELSQQNPEYGVISPVHFNGQGSRLDSSFARYIGGKLPISSKKSALVEVTFINAAFWFMPVTVLRKVGGFSPLFFHYGEDVDYIHRVRYSRAMQMRLDRIYYLTVVADVNGSLFSRLWGGILAPWKPALRALLRGRWSEALFYVAASGRLLWQYSYITAVRESCKRGLPVFLESIHSKIRPIWN